MNEALALNLHRLVYFHHRTARDAADVIGVAERTLNAWLNGKRSPSYSKLMDVAKVYRVDPSLLDGDPLKFAPQLGDPERIKLAETEGIPEARKARKRERLHAVETPPHGSPHGVSHSG